MGEIDSLRLEVENLRTALAAEKAARLTHETQLKQLSASLPIAVWMSDIDNNIVFVNDNWYDLLGLRAENIATWGRSIHVEDRRRALAAFAAAASSRERLAIEFRTAGPDEQDVWVLAVAAPRYCAEGRYTGYVGALIDTSERRAANAALEYMQSRLSMALECTKVGVWDWDVVSGAVWLSDSALEIQGYSHGEVRSHAAGFEPHIHPDDWPVYQQQLKDCLKGVTPLIHAENRLRRKDGSWVWVAERAGVVERDTGGRALRMIGTRTDMTEQRARDERIRWLAAHDVLTGLPNRARFQELLLAAMRETDGHGGRMALLMLDVDRFKQVNDSQGHDAGDMLLRRIGRQLRHAFPAPASVARVGGDEFAVILPGVGADVARIAARAVLGGNGKLDSTASVGAALYPDDAITAAALVKCADVALYRAKERGRARAVVYGAESSRR